ncbi:unnamed protein product [Lampetra fluviatilis]
MRKGKVRHRAYEHAATSRRPPLFGRHQIDGGRWRHHKPTLALKSHSEILLQGGVPVAHEEVGGGRGKASAEPAHPALSPPPPPPVLPTLPSVELPPPP